MHDDDDRSWIPSDTFALRLTIIRAYLNLSQVEAATACGLKPSTWATWERGADPRGFDRIVKAIAEGLLVDRDWLTFGGPLRSRCFASLTLVPAVDGQMELAFVEPPTLTSV